MVLDEAGTLWTASSKEGVCRLQRGSAAFSCDSTVINDHVVSLLTTPGFLWLGTSGSGLRQLRDAPIHVLTTADGLPGNNIGPVAVDRDGSLWIGTRGKGLAHIEAGRVRTITTKDGLPDNFIRSLATARDGGVWIGTDTGMIAHVRNGTIRHIQTTLPSVRIHALLEDATGRLWVAPKGAGLGYLEGGRFHFVNRQRLLRPRSLDYGRDGNILAGQSTGELAIVRRDGSVRILGKAEGLPPVPLVGAVEDPDGTLWLASWGQGLIRVRGKEVVAAGIAQGMPSESLYDVLTDSRGSIWVTSSKGIVRVERSDFDALAQKRTQFLRHYAYDENDGMLVHECNGSLPAIVETVDGRLIFPTITGVAVLDRARLSRARPVPAAPSVEQFIANGSPIAGAATVLPPKTKQIDFAFTAFDYSAPGRIRFKYLLEGFDLVWKPAGDIRRATYTNLAPGTYRFRVRAENVDGLPNTREAIVTFHHQAAFTQTSWFIAVLAVLAAALAFTAYTIRVRHMRRNEKQLVDLVRHRTSSLAEANEMLKQLSLTDQLTGLANRRSLDEAVAREWSRARRSESWLSFILIDVDFFKIYNDTYGHQSGDSCLKNVASALRSMKLRSVDVVARYGGEEFCVVLPDCSAENAYAVAETLRTAVAELLIPHSGSRIASHVTISLGIASTIPEADFTAEELLLRADTALYDAKKQGRNQASIYHEPVAQIAA